MDLPWLDRPKSFAVAAAMAELTALGCVKDGAITEAGVRLFSLPLDVGLARLLVEGAMEPGLSEPTLLLAAALSVDRPIFRRSDRKGPIGLHDLRAGGCDAAALIEAVRSGDPYRDDLDAKALDEARAAADRFRKLGFGDPRASRGRSVRLTEPPEGSWSEGTRVEVDTPPSFPRRALAELLIRVWPGCAHVRRDQKKHRFTWAAGGTEMELDADSAVRPADTEAIIVLDSRAVAAQDRPGSGLLITAAMPVQFAWLAVAGLGEPKASRPELQDDVLLVTISQMYAGKVLTTREEVPTGDIARVAIRDLALEGRLMKQQKLRASLEERHQLAMLAAQVAGTEALLPLPEWLLARLTDLGLESADDLGLLSVEDLLPALPPAAVIADLERRFPRTLDTGEAKYEIEYQVAERIATFHQVRGIRKEPPSPTHLPRLPGFRLFWEHKNRVQPIVGRS
jgi:HrpA-like RNA helicase